MTKRSAIAVAMGLVASILVAAVALSMNFEIGTPAAATGQTAKIEKKAHKNKPIVKRRTVTIHRDKPARTIGGGTITVASGGSGSTGSSGGTSARSASGSSFSSHSDDSFEHESGGGGGGEGGDD